MQELLEDKAENPVCNAALQRQFYLMMQGHVRKRLSRDFAESAALYEQAIRITIPDFPCQMSDSILLNVQEICFCFSGRRCSRIKDIRKNC